MKKVSEGEVISDGDFENPSEEDQLKWALEQSLNTDSDSKNDFNEISDQIKVQEFNRSFLLFSY